MVVHGRELHHAALTQAVQARCSADSHVGPSQKIDLHVIGSGFDAYEGLMVRIIVTLGEPNYGLGESPIVSGAFDIALPGVLGDYTGIAVHVDRVRDDACNPDTEFIWQTSTGPAGAFGPGFTTSPSGAVVWEITPSKLRIVQQVGPCSLNGIFDLSIPLRCPAQK
jgi:hypothetical protein